MLHFKIFLKYNGATNESPIIVSITPGLRVNSVVIGLEAELLSQFLANFRQLKIENTSVYSILR